MHGIKVWGSSCRTQLASLRRLTDKCLKILSYDVFNIENNESRFLNSDHLYNYFCLIRVFKCIQCGTNDHFSDRFSELVSTHTFQTWFSVNKKLNYPRIVCSQYYKSFVYNEQVPRSHFAAMERSLLLIFASEFLLYNALYIHTRIHTVYKFLLWVPIRTWTPNVTRLPVLLTSAIPLNGSCLYPSSHPLPPRVVPTWPVLNHSCKS